MDPIIKIYKNGQGRSNPGQSATQTGQVEGASDLTHASNLQGSDSGQTVLVSSGQTPNTKPTQNSEDSNPAEIRAALAQCTELPTRIKGAILTLLEGGG